MGQGCCKSEKEQKLAMPTLQTNNSKGSKLRSISVKKGNEEEGQMDFKRQAKSQDPKKIQNSPLHTIKEEPVTNPNQQENNQKKKEFQEEKQKPRPKIQISKEKSDILQQDQNINKQIPQNQNQQSLKKSSPQKRNSQGQISQKQIQQIPPRKKSGKEKLPIQKTPKREKIREQEVKKGIPVNHAQIRDDLSHSQLLENDSQAISIKSQNIIDAKEFKTENRRNQNISSHALGCQLEKYQQETQQLKSHQQVLQSSKESSHLGHQNKIDNNEKKIKSQQPLGEFNQEYSNQNQQYSQGENQQSEIQLEFTEQTQYKKQRPGNFQSQYNNNEYKIEIQEFQSNDMPGKYKKSVGTEQTESDINQKKYSLLENQIDQELDINNQSINLQTEAFVAEEITQELTNLPRLISKELSFQIDWGEEEESFQMELIIDSNIPQPKNNQRQFFEQTDSTQISGRNSNSSLSQISQTQNEDLYSQGDSIVSEAPNIRSQYQLGAEESEQSMSDISWQSLLDQKDKSKGRIPRHRAVQQSQQKQSQSEKSTPVKANRQFSSQKSEIEQTKQQYQENNSKEIYDSRGQRLSVEGDIDKQSQKPKKRTKKKKQQTEINQKSSSQNIKKRSISVINQISDDKQMNEINEKLINQNRINLEIKQPKRSQQQQQSIENSEVYEVKKKAKTKQQKIDKEKIEQKIFQETVKHSSSDVQIENAPRPKGAIDGNQVTPSKNKLKGKDISIIQATESNIIQVKEKKQTKQQQKNSNPHQLIKEEISSPQTQSEYQIQRQASNSLTNTPKKSNEQQSQIQISASITNTPKNVNRAIKCKKSQQQQAEYQTLENVNKSLSSQSKRSSIQDKPDPQQIQAQNIEGFKKMQYVDVQKQNKREEENKSMQQAITRTRSKSHKEQTNIEQQFQADNEIVSKERTSTPEIQQQGNVQSDDYYGSGKKQKQKRRKSAGPVSQQRQEEHNQDQCKAQVSLAENQVLNKPQSQQIEEDKKMNKEINNKLIIQNNQNLENELPKKGQQQQQQCTNYSEGHEIQKGAKTDKQKLEKEKIQQKSFQDNVMHNSSGLQIENLSCSKKQTERNQATPVKNKLKGKEANQMIQASESSNIQFKGKQQTQQQEKTSNHYYQGKEQQSQLQTQPQYQIQRQELKSLTNIPKEQNQYQPQVITSVSITNTPKKINKSPKRKKAKQQESVPKTPEKLKDKLSNQSKLNVQQIKPQQYQIEAQQVESSKQTQFVEVQKGINQEGQSLPDQQVMMRIRSQSHNEITNSEQLHQLDKEASQKECLTTREHYQQENVQSGDQQGSERKIKKKRRKSTGVLSQQNKEEFHQNEQKVQQAQAENQVSNKSQDKSHQLQMESAKIENFKDIQIADVQEDKNKARVNLPMEQRISKARSKSQIEQTNREQLNQVDKEITQKELQSTSECQKQEKTQSGEQQDSGRKLKTKRRQSAGILSNQNIEALNSDQHQVQVAQSLNQVSDKPQNQQVSEIRLNLKQQNNSQSAIVTPRKKSIPQEKQHQQTEPNEQAFNMSKNINSIDRQSETKQNFKIQKQQVYETNALQHQSPEKIKKKLPNQSELTTIQDKPEQLQTDKQKIESIKQTQFANVQKGNNNNKEEEEEESLQKQQTISSARSQSHKEQKNRELLLQIDKDASQKECLTTREHYQQGNIQGSDQESGKKLKSKRKKSAGLLSNYNLEALKSDQHQVQVDQSENQVSDKPQNQQFSESHLNLKQQNNSESAKVTPRKKSIPQEKQHQQFYPLEQAQISKTQNSIDTQSETKQNFKIQKQQEIKQDALQLQTPENLKKKMSIQSKITTVQDKSEQQQIEAQKIENQKQTQFVTVQKEQNKEEENMQQQQSISKVRSNSHIEQTILEQQYLQVDKEIVSKENPSTPELQQQGKVQSVDQGSGNKSKPNRRKSDGQHKQQNVEVLHQDQHQVQVAQSEIQVLGTLQNKQAGEIRQNLKTQMYSESSKVTPRKKSIQQEIQQQQSEPEKQAMQSSQNENPINRQSETKQKNVKIQKQQEIKSDSLQNQTPQKLKQKLSNQTQQITKQDKSQQQQFVAQQVEGFKEEQFIEVQKRKNQEVESLPNQQVIKRTRSQSNKEQVNREQLLLVDTQASSTESPTTSELQQEKAQGGEQQDSGNKLKSKRRISAGPLNHQNIEALNSDQRQVQVAQLENQVSNKPQGHQVGENQQIVKVQQNSESPKKTPRKKSIPQQNQNKQNESEEQTFEISQTGKSKDTQQETKQNFKIQKHQEIKSKNAIQEEQNLQSFKQSLKVTENKNKQKPNEDNSATAQQNQLKMNKLQKIEKSEATQQVTPNKNEISKGSTEKQMQQQASEINKMGQYESRTVILQQTPQKSQVVKVSKSDVMSNQIDTKFNKTGEETIQVKSHLNQKQANQIQQAQPDKKLGQFSSQDRKLNIENQVQNQEIDQKTKGMKKKQSQSLTPGHEDQENMQKIAAQVTQKTIQSDENLISRKQNLSKNNAEQQPQKNKIQEDNISIEQQINNQKPVREISRQNDTDKDRCTNIQQIYMKEAIDNQSSAQELISKPITEQRKTEKASMIKTQKNKNALQESLQSSEQAKNQLNIDTENKQQIEVSNQLDKSKGKKTTKNSMNNSKKLVDKNFSNQQENNKLLYQQEQSLENNFNSQKQVQQSTLGNTPQAIAPNKKKYEQDQEYTVQQKQKSKKTTNTIECQLGHNQIQSEIVNLQKNTTSQQIKQTTIENVKNELQLEQVQSQPKTQSMDIQKRRHTVIVIDNGKAKDFVDNSNENNKSLDFATSEQSKRNPIQLTQSSELSAKQTNKQTEIKQTLKQNKKNVEAKKQQQQNISAQDNAKVQKNKIQKIQRKGQSISEQSQPQILQTQDKSSNKNLQSVNENKKAKIDNPNTNIVQNQKLSMEKQEQIHSQDSQQILVTQKKVKDKPIIPKLKLPLKDETHQHLQQPEFTNQNQNQIYVNESQSVSERLISKKDSQNNQNITPKISSGRISINENAEIEKQNQKKETPNQQQELREDQAVDKAATERTLENTELDKLYQELKETNLLLSKTLQNKQFAPETNQLNSQQQFKDTDNSQIKQLSQQDIDIKFKNKAKEKCGQSLISFQNNQKMTDQQIEVQLNLSQDEYLNNQSQQQKTQNRNKQQEIVDLKKSVQMNHEEIDFDKSESWGSEISQENSRQEDLDSAKLIFQGSGSGEFEASCEMWDSLLLNIESPQLNQKDVDQIEFTSEAVKQMTQIESKENSIRSEQKQIEHQTPFAATATKSKETNQIEQQEKDQQNFSQQEHISKHKSKQEEKPDEKKTIKIKTHIDQIEFEKESWDSQISQENSQQEDLNLAKLNYQELDSIEQQNSKDMLNISLLNNESQLSDIKDVDQLDVPKDIKTTSQIELKENQTLSKQKQEIEHQTPSIVIPTKNNESNEIKQLEKPQQDPSQHKNKQEEKTIQKKSVRFQTHYEEFEIEKYSWSSEASQENSQQEDLDSAKLNSQVSCSAEQLGSEDMWNTFLSNNESNQPDQKGVHQFQFTHEGVKNITKIEPKQNQMSYKQKQQLELQISSTHSPNKNKEADEIEQQQKAQQDNSQQSKITQHENKQEEKTIQKKSVRFQTHYEEYEIEKYSWSSEASQENSQQEDLDSAKLNSQGSCSAEQLGSEDMWNTFLSNNESQEPDKKDVHQFEVTSEGIKKTSTIEQKGQQMSSQQKQQIQLQQPIPTTNSKQKEANKIEQKEKAKKDFSQQQQIAEHKKKQEEKKVKHKSIKNQTDHDDIEIEKYS